MLAPRSSRRGVALAEMMVAVSLFGVVLAAFGTLLARHERAHAQLDARVGADAQLREGELVLTEELRALSPALGDISEARDSAIAIRALVAEGIACDTSGLSFALPPADSEPSRTQVLRRTTPQSFDSAWVWADTGGARTWRGYGVNAVSTSTTRCAGVEPSGARTVITLRAGTLPPAFVPGAAVRITRRERWSLYKGGDNRWWLGLREQAATTGTLATIQPVVGPLRPYSPDPSRSGLTLAFEDAAGLAIGGSVADPTRIALIRLVIRADSAASRAAPHARVVRDTITSVVAPRG